MSHPNLFLTSKQQYWLEHINACERSGLTMKQYAANHGLSLHSFYESKTKLKKKGLFTSQSPSILFTQATLSTDTGSCQITLPDGVVINLDPHGDPLWAAAFIKALG